MDDLISRQAAIDALKNRWKKTRNYEGIGDDIAEECELYLKQVPSAQPERKKGKWRLADIQNPNDKANGNYLYFCSNCFHADLHAKTQEVPYCWYCGAEMEVEG